MLMIASDQILFKYVFICRMDTYEFSRKKHVAVRLVYKLIFQAHGHEIKGSDALRKMTFLPMIPSSY